MSYASLDPLRKNILIIPTLSKSTKCYGHLCLSQICSFSPFVAHQSFISIKSNEESHQVYTPEAPQEHDAREPVRSLTTRWHNISPIQTPLRLPTRFPCRSFPAGRF